MPLIHTIWTRKSPSFPEHSEYMEVFPDVGRIICAVVTRDGPVRYAPMSMSYVDVQDGLIRTQLRPDSKWKDDIYKIEEDLIFWNHDGNEKWPWQSIPQDQLPSWFQSFQEKAQTKMDERVAACRNSKSKTEQGGAANQASPGG